MLSESTIRFFRKLLSIYLVLVGLALIIGAAASS